MKIPQDPATRALIDRAATAFRQPGADIVRTYRDADCCASSENADKILITWYYLHHYNQAPLHIKASRGYTYRVTMRASECKVKTVDSRDHRNGVVELQSA